ncbi:MAG: hypothetical protein R3C44_08190 [Chloroflexota bacterium]
MRRSDLIWLIVILLVVAGGVWIVTSPNFPIRLGLDLQGGLQVLLEADVPPDQDITAAQMDTSRQVVDRRVNALGVTEPLVQVEGDRRILVELPGVDDPEEAISLIQETALLEFVDTGDTSLPEGTCIRTSLSDEPSRCEFLPGQPLTSTIESPAPTYPTVMTGAGLRDATVGSDQYGQFFVDFVLTDEASDIFAEHTGNNVGKFLTIVLDKEVISSPVINDVIEGSGQISGQFTWTKHRSWRCSLNTVACRCRCGLKVRVKLVRR